jgi:hypothetical protein
VKKWGKEGKKGAAGSGSEAGICFVAPDVSEKSSSRHELGLKARFTRLSFPRASLQRHRICGWENPGVLTSYTLVSVLVSMTYVHVVTANPSLPLDV